MESLFASQLHQMGSNFVGFDASSSSFDVTLDMKKHYANRALMKNKRKWKKPRGKPKRPLSAYNIFFKQEREKLVKAKKKVGFANMAKEISAKWKKLNDEERKEFVAAADVEQQRYRAAVKEWKKQSKVEMELLHAASHSPLDGPSPLAPLLSQTNPAVLQRLMIEQQMMEQQQLMRAQMENAIRIPGARRMSMPLMGTGSSSTPNPTPEFQPQTIQRQAPMGRRFSMPMQTTVLPNMNHSGSNMGRQPVAIDLTQTSYESTDESSLDDETADLLINMPIMDLEGKQQQHKPQDPTSSIPLSPRRSSMPLVTQKKLDELDVRPIGPSSTRRLSLPQLSDEVKEMQDILAMLDEDDSPSFSSKSPTAA